MLLVDMMLAKRTVEKPWIVLAGECVKFGLIVALLFLVAPPTREENAKYDLIYCVSFFVVLIISSILRLCKNK